MLINNKINYYNIIMNFIFMILLILVILLLVYVYLVDIDKKIITLSLLGVIIIFEIYNRLEKPETFSLLDSSKCIVSQKRNIPCSSSHNKVNMGLNKLLLNCNNIDNKETCEKYNCVYDESNQICNYDIDENIIKTKKNKQIIEGKNQCDIYYNKESCVKNGCYFSDNRKCINKESYCNLIEDTCNDPLCQFKNDKCISNDIYCNNFSSKRECNKESKCTYNDMNNVCSTKGLHNNINSQCHIYDDTDCTLIQRIDKCNRNLNEKDCENNECVFYNYNCISILEYLDILNNMKDMNENFYVKYIENFFKPIKSKINSNKIDLIKLKIMLKNNLSGLYISPIYQTFFNRPTFIRKNKEKILRNNKIVTPEYKFNSNNKGIYSIKSSVITGLENENNFLIKDYLIKNNNIDEIKKMRVTEWLSLLCLINKYNYAIETQNYERLKYIILYNKEDETFYKNLNDTTVNCLLLNETKYNDFVSFNNCDGEDAVCVSTLIFETHTEIIYNNPLCQLLKPPHDIHNCKDYNNDKVACELNKCEYDVVNSSCTSKYACYNKCSNLNKDLCEKNKYIYDKPINTNIDICQFTSKDGCKCNINIQDSCNN